MNWRKIRTLLLAFLAAFLLVFGTRVAVAQNESEV